MPDRREVATGGGWLRGVRLLVGCARHCTEPRSRIGGRLPAAAAAVLFVRRVVQLHIVVTIIVITAAAAVGLAFAATVVITRICVGVGVGLRVIVGVLFTTRSSAGLHFGTNSCSLPLS